MIFDIKVKVNTSNNDLACNARMFEFGIIIVYITTVTLETKVREKMMHGSVKS